MRPHSLNLHPLLQFLPRGVEWRVADDNVYWTSLQRGEYHLSRIGLDELDPFYCYLVFGQVSPSMVEGGLIRFYRQLIRTCQVANLLRESSKTA